MFAEASRENRAGGDMNYLGKRESAHTEISGLSIQNLTMKHLIFYLENDSRFRKSKYLFKAYMSR
jgi:hypothetical protein